MVARNCFSVFQTLCTIKGLLTLINLWYNIISQHGVPYYPAYTSHFYTVQHLCQGGGMRVINGYMNQNIFTSIPRVVN